MSQYIFYFLAFVALFSGILVVSSKSPVHSVLYLIVCFFAIAGHYFLLNAQFLGIVHMIVYAGAIMVLFLFVIMLLNLNASNEVQKGNLIKFAAVVASGIFMLTVIAAIKKTETTMAAPASFSDIGMVENIGKHLFNEFLLPFEISSVLLISAMVGAVILTKKELD